MMEDDLETNGDPDDLTGSRIFAKGNLLPASNADALALASIDEKAGERRSAQYSQSIVICSQHEHVTTMRFTWPSSRTTSICGASRCPNSRSGSALHLPAESSGDRAAKKD